MGNNMIYILTFTAIFVSAITFGQNSNVVLESAKAPFPPCFYAKHKSHVFIIFDNDTINQYQEPENTVKYGKWVYFRKNGYVKKEGFFEWGMKQGYWKYYSKNNQLIKTIKYKNNQKLEVLDSKKNIKYSFDYKKQSEKWDFGESRFLEKGKCQIKY